MINKANEQKRKRGRPRKKLEDKLSKVLTTDRQNVFFRNRLAGMNKRQAAIQAGYASRSASVMANRITDKILKSRIFIEEMERQGVTVNSIARKLKELLECRNPFRPAQPDNMVQLKALKLICEIMDVYPPKKR